MGTRRRLLPARNMWDLTVTVSTRRISLLYTAAEAHTIWYSAYVDSRF
jgi:hypothetical protein